MNPTFDLLESPWLPCIRADGTPVELGLRDALVRSHELLQLGGDSPLVVAALHRLLLAVLHRVFGPADAREWAELWDAGRWDAARLDAYLGQWQHRFDLFDGERPFYQAPDDRVKTKSVNSLIHQVASGNNRTLFDHHVDERGITLTPGQAARMLLAAQAFGLSGLCAPGLPNFTYGPCVRGIIFLVQGDTLFETLALNLLPYPDDSIFLGSPKDRPSWEMDNPLFPDRSRPRGYLDYLTWFNRRVLLTADVVSDKLVVREMTMAPGLALSEEVQDPMKHFFKHKRLGLLPLRFREDRALWRDSAALFELRSTASRPPRALAWLAELIDEEYLRNRHQTHHCLALGIGIGKKAADVDFCRSERIPLSTAVLRDDELVGNLRQMLDMAEKAAQRLSDAALWLAILGLSPAIDGEPAKVLRTLPKNLRDTASDLREQWAVEQRYWPHLELPFRLTMEALPQDREGALESWRKTLWKAAWDAFDQVTGSLDHDPGKLKAVVRARGQLAGGLVKVLPKP
jgi:CRISPR system Cascade subunit CasA